MRLQKLFAHLCACCLLVLLFAIAVSADTIVLKNGRKIVAMNVVEDGDKIHYETPSGTLTLPKSIVDHIIKGVGGMPGTPAQAAAELAITPPALQAIGLASAGNEIEQGAVHDGSIDRAFIAKLESAVRSGGKAASDSAALARHTAAQFEIAQGDLEHALTDERTALGFAPDNPDLLTNMAYLHLRRSEFKQSLEYLDRAKRIAADNPDIPKLAGWAYYGLNKINEAVAEWKRSLALRADPEVQAALDKALKDKQEEESYKENESLHFNLKYSGAAEPALAREVLRTLEAHYNAIESELNFSTPDSIGVILYTQQAFADITSAPNWVGAVNDGRIRVPVQGLTSMTPELSRVLKHELTHSFIQQKTRRGAPTWLQEGLAQWMEGKRSGESAAALVQIYEAKQSAPLAQLEGSWMKFTGDTASYAYAWSLANVEAIVQASGMSDIVRILDAIGAGQSAEAALKSVLRDNYEDQMQATVDYLKKNYAR